MPNPAPSNPLPWPGTPLDKVCVAITARSPAAMIERAAAALGANGFLELRLDSLPDPMLLPPLLANLRTQRPEARLIATCRRTEAGGGFHGSLAGELAVLEAASRAGCSIADLALESADAMHLDQHRIFREALRAAGTALLLSYHDYTGTRDLALNLARLTRYQPDLVKIVSTAVHLSDNLAMLALLSARHSLPMIGMAMGEAGTVSRVLGPRAGSLFTFAAADDGEPTAPGQLSATTLRSLYRIDSISAATRIYGVAGKPIAHSLSPLVHNTAFRAMSAQADTRVNVPGSVRGKIDAVFLPLLTDSAEELVRVARELPLAGVSVTMPLKQSILPLLDYVDPLAARVGACNTVVRTEAGALHGYNTDVAGIIVPLEQRLSLRGARVLVHGAGGAARAAVFGLRERGAQVWILNRTPARAAALAAEADASVAEPVLLREACFDVLVNATPAGMHTSPSAQSEQDNEQENDPLPFPLPPGTTRLPAGLIFDMVYRPAETPLIRLARSQGLSVITGAEMFIQQAVRQCELWTGLEAPEHEIRSVVRDALGIR